MASRKTSLKNKLLKQTKSSVDLQQKFWKLQMMIAPYSMLVLVVVTASCAPTS